jgi:hypothetical protein
VDAFSMLHHIHGYCVLTISPEAISGFESFLSQVTAQNHGVEAPVVQKAITTLHN